ncbi:2-keto-3-deoxygluconate permease [Bordetella pertussis]
MLLPLILGSLLGTFAPDALAIGGFTTALFKNSALPLIALLIFATGTQVNMRTGGPILATAGTILLMKTLVPATLIILLGHFVGLDGVLGISILAMLAAFDNSNGVCGSPTPGNTATAAIAAPTSPARSTTARSSACCSGRLGPGGYPDHRTGGGAGAVPAGRGGGQPWTSNGATCSSRCQTSLIPFFAFALAPGINLGAVISGGMSGLVLGLLISPITGALVYFGYRYILRRGGKSGLGFAAGTTAGNAIATPAVVAAADPSFQPYVATATAQVAACVLISSILAPVLASYFLKRAGELSRWSRSRRTSAPASPPK